MHRSNLLENFASSHQQRWRDGRIAVWDPRIAVVLKHC
jgi:hypothetical protein